MFAGNLLVAAEDDLLEGLLEVVVEGDVDHGVDHGVAVREHVEPEPVLLHQARQLTWGKGMFIVQCSCRYLWSYVVLRGKFISRHFLSCWCSKFFVAQSQTTQFSKKGNLAVLCTFIAIALSKFEFS